MSGFGLKCQECSSMEVCKNISHNGESQKCPEGQNCIFDLECSGIGLCKSKSDNGESKECQTGEVCIFSMLNGKGLKSQ